MDKIWLILKENRKNLNIIFRIAKYENKASYQAHYLGVVWEILNPLLQVLVFYLIFGLGLRGNSDVNGVPFIVWLVIGQATWMFVNSSVLGGSDSIRSNLSLVAKMNFPMSTLPFIAIVRRFNPFFVKIIIGMVSALFVGILPTLHWLQIIYYFFAMILFALFMIFLTSTIKVLFTDFQFILNTIMRLVFFTSGIMIPLEDMQGRLGALLRLNPFHYLISGFRDALLFQVNFWERGTQTLFFWAFTLFIGLIGVHLHLKFRRRFTDFT